MAGFKLVKVVSHRRGRSNVIRHVRGGVNLGGRVKPNWKPGKTHSYGMSSGPRRKKPVRGGAAVRSTMVAFRPQSSPGNLPKPAAARRGKRKSGSRAKAAVEKVQRQEASRGGIHQKIGSKGKLKNQKSPGHTYYNPRDEPKAKVKTVDTRKKTAMKKRAADRRRSNKRLNDALARAEGYPNYKAWERENM